MKILLLALLPLLTLGSVLAAPEAVPNVTPDEAQKLIQEKKDLVVLDVRTPEEFEKGHIAGAKNVDLLADDFAAKAKGLDKSKVYLVHCAAGSRSTRALRELTGEGLKGLYHMNGGFNAWEKAGKPVVTGGGK